MADRFQGWWVAVESPDFEVATRVGPRKVEWFWRRDDALAQRQQRALADCEKYAYSNDAPFWVVVPGWSDDVV